MLFNIDRIVERALDDPRPTLTSCLAFNSAQLESRLKMTKAMVKKKEYVNRCLNRVVDKR